MIKKNRTLLLGIIGIIFIGYGFYKGNVEKYKYSFNDVPPPATAQKDIRQNNDESVTDEKPTLQPSRIVISDLGLDLNVEESSIEDGVWQVSDDAVSFLNRSAKPGEGGNIVLYGHNKWHVLGKLPDIRVGNLIEVYDDEGEKLVYKVEDTFIVSPDEVGVVQPTEHEILTLYTCTGVLDSKRFIVKAKPVDNSEAADLENI